MVEKKHIVETYDPSTLATRNLNHTNNLWVFLVILTAFVDIASTAWMLHVQLTKAMISKEIGRMDTTEPMIRLYEGPDMYAKGVMGGFDQSNMLPCRGLLSCETELTSEIP